jgi:N-acetylneuraminate epimerase
LVKKIVTGAARGVAGTAPAACHLSYQRFSVVWGPGVRHFGIMDIPRAAPLLSLAPVTLGDAAGLVSALSAHFDAAARRWCVTWSTPAGATVQATCPVGGTAWSKPAAASVLPAPPVAAPATDGPKGVITLAASPAGRAALRSGKRITGQPPRFPGAGLIFSIEEAGGWRDLGFADETPDLEIKTAALAVTDGGWLAAYLIADAAGRSVCRAVQLPRAPAASSPSAWTMLPPYPQAPGMAGNMAGVHRGVLIACGGANWPDLKPWENGVKKMYDTIFVLLPGATAWTAAGHLPKPRAYGATVSVPDGVMIVGGESGTEVFQDTLLLHWDGNQVQIRTGPALPAAVTCAVAAVLDGSVYLAGGYGSGAPRLSADFFWRLNLADAAPGWQVLPAWPGRTRALAVAAAVGGAFYLLSGIEVAAAPGMTPPEAAPGVYLADAYRYRPGAAWEKLPDLPWTAIAAPSPAPVTTTPARVFVLGGVDGRQVGNLPRATALPEDIIYFDVAQHAWKLWPQTWPTPVVCICGVDTPDGWILPTGETMAGHRTTDVWSWRIGS